MKSKILAAAGLVFGSGAAALLYQTAWLREFRLVFGSSTAATAAVLGIFMGGLGLGSALLGRRVEADPRPLAFYARLELLIAASAALTPALIWLIRAAYLSLGGTLALGIGLGTIVRLLLAAVALLVPTFLMGGTLPALARFAVTAEDDSRRGLAALYGMNTLGAVAGAGLGTFLLFEKFGNHLTLWLACALNAIVAGLAAWLARTETVIAPVKAKRTETETAAPAISHRVVLFSAALSGFLFLVMEIVWFRMLSAILGGTTFTMGLILGVALLGIGAGGVAYGLAFQGRRPTLGGLALTCALESLCLAIPFAIGDRLALASILLTPLGSLGFYARVIGWSVLCGIVVFPAAFVAGIQFPLLVSLLGKGRREIGTQTGAAYAWNTGGAIAGSIAGGFVLLPLLSATGVWRLVVCILSLWALGAAIENGRITRSWLRPMPAIAVSVLAVCLLLSLGPTAAWRHGQFGIGTEKNLVMTPNQIRELLHNERRDILWEADGVEASIGIAKDDSLAFIVNGKCDGNVKGDAGTQVMAGLLGGLFHPSPTRAAVVGLGTGSTAGWLAAIPSMERVDVMEIEPVVARFAAQCALVNENIMQSPKLRLIIGDARETLLTLREPYDIIVSEPSNPYRVGIANLFTREYYEAARARLRPNGFFVQWLQTYRVDFATVTMFYATFQSVFPYVETWQSEGGDLLLIGSQGSQLYDVGSLRQRIKQSPFREGLAQVWRMDDLEGVFSHYVSNNGFPQSILSRRKVELNTDDRPLLEFAFARNLTDTSVFDFASLRQAAALSGTDHPFVTAGNLDWEKVEAGRVSMLLATNQGPTEGPPGDAEREKLYVVLRNYSDGRLADALDAWKQLQRDPQNMLELLMVAECEADKGESSAVNHIDRMRQLGMPEAEAVAARYLWRQKRTNEAATMLVAAFVKFRNNPWPINAASERAMELACEIASGSGDASIAGRFYEALQEPFAVYNGNESRLDVLVRIALVLDENVPGRYCLAEIEKAEPFIPWRRNFLRLRGIVYTRANHPLAAAARRDMDKFLEAESGLSKKEPAPSDSEHVASLSQ